MNQNLKQMVKNSELNLVKVLHIIMLVLCFIATIVLFSNPSTSAKLLLSLILVLYTIMILRNSNTTKLIFKVDRKQSKRLKYQDSHSYSSLKSWQVDGSKEKNKSTSSYPTGVIPTNTNLPWKNKEEEMGAPAHLSKSFDKSMDIKNMSISLYRSLTGSGMHESKMSRMKSSRRRDKPKGFDLEEMFQADGSLSFASTKTQSSGIKLLDCQTYLEKTSEFAKIADNAYEKTVKEYLKQKPQEVTSKYESIQNYIQSILKSHMNQHKFTIEKLKEFSEDSFEVTIEGKKENQKYERNLSSEYSHQKISLNLFLYKMLLIKQKKIGFRELNLELKKDKRWSRIQPRIEQHLNSIIRLSQLLGIDNQLLKSHFKENTKKFVEQYFSFIDMIETYMANEHHHNSKSRQSLKADTLFYLAKCRLFILYLVCREINSNAKETGKVKFNDHLNFKYPEYESYQLEVNKKVGSEDPLSHYDVYTIKDGKLQHKLSCQSGETNFLSVILFVVRELSRKTDLFVWKPHLRSLISELR